MKTSDFKHGDAVTYTSFAGKVEHGVVSSINEAFVFVKYNNAAYIVVSGDERIVAMATNPNDLTLR